MHYSTLHDHLLFFPRDYKPEYERLKKERMAEVAAEQQKQLDRLKKDVAKEGDSSVPINTGCKYWFITEIPNFTL